MLADPRRPANLARFVYLDPASQEFFVDWRRTVDDVVATLRSALDRSAQGKALTGLVGELSMCSESFRIRWAPPMSATASLAKRSCTTRRSATSNSTSRRWTSRPRPG